MINLTSIQAYNANNLVDKPAISPKPPLIEPAVISNEKTPDIDSVSISDMAQQRLKFEKIEQQICCVFKGGKQLTQQEEKQQVAIVGQINNLYGYPDEELPIENKALADKIKRQTDVVIAEEDLNVTENKQLVALSERIKLSYPRVKEAILSNEQQQQLTGLVTQLDKLHDVSSIKKDQLLQVQDLFVQLDQLKGATEGDQSGIYHF